MPRKTKPKPSPRHDPSPEERDELISIYPEAEGLTPEQVVERILDAPREDENED